MVETLHLHSDDIGIATAAELLGAGGLVAFPTETVYGLGADATNDRAVARIFEAKGRPQFNPLIVHLADPAAVAEFAVLEGSARRLAETFWPGALTLVLPLRPASAVSPLVSAGNQSIAVRVPADPVARRLLQTFGGPVAAPSANPSGRVSPTRAAHVLAGLDGLIEAVIDGGPCSVGVESTIVAIQADGAEPPRVLRPGGIAVETIEAALGRPLHNAAAADASAPLAPGMLESHYAPEAPVRLNATQAEADEVLLGFGVAPGAALNLSESGDLIEAAANLFHDLRRIDVRAQGRRIAVSPIPEYGLGRAINDRLRRAAAPRS